jgi:protein SCO1/2
MKTRTAHIVLVLAAFAGGLAVFLATFLYATGNLSGSGGGSFATIGGPFQLVDQNGNAITDRDLKGRPHLVFFGYTHCPDVCPTTLFELSEVMQALGADADRTAALFITVDPERDSPSVIKDYLSSFDKHLRGATGTPAAIAAAEKAYRVYAQKVPGERGEYTMDHTALIYLMDKEGRFVAPFSLNRKPEAAAADLRKYM